MCLSPRQSRCWGRRRRRDRCDVGSEEKEKRHNGNEHGSSRIQSASSVGNEQSIASLPRQIPQLVSTDLSLLVPRSCALSRSMVLCWARIRAMKNGPFIEARDPREAAGVTFRRLAVLPRGKVGIGASWCDPPCRVPGVGSPGYRPELDWHLTVIPQLGAECDVRSQDEVQVLPDSPDRSAVEVFFPHLQ